MEFVIILIGLYLLPAIIAFGRQHRNTAPIVVVTILLGWTGIAWIICLAWAFSYQRRED